MNHLKDWVSTAHPGVKHFLTYADNYAFGYFKKQVSVIFAQKFYYFALLIFTVGVHKRSDITKIILGRVYQRLRGRNHHAMHHASSHCLSSSRTIAPSTKDAHSGEN